MHISGGENSFYTGERTTGNGDDVAAFIEVYLTFKKSGIGCMSDGEEDSVYGFFRDFTGFDIFNADGSDAGFFFADDVFDPETFDLVLAVNVIYHGLPADFARAVAHAHRWLRSNGLFYFTCPTLDDENYGSGVALDHNTFEFEPGHVHYHAMWEDLESLLTGFRLVSRKKRDHRWEEGGVDHLSSRWQVLVEKP